MSQSQSPNNPDQLQSFKQDGKKEEISPFPRAESDRHIVVGNSVENSVVISGDSNTVFRTGDIRLGDGSTLKLVVTGENKAPTTAPLSVAPAHASEILVLIAEFDGDGQIGWKIEERIRKAIEKEMTVIGGSTFRVARLRNLVIEDGDDEKARKVAELCNAAIIIWGWYDQVGFSPRFTIVTNKELESSNPELEEMMVDVTNQTFKDYMFRGLAEEMAFLATFTIGQLFYWDHRYQEALAAFERSIAQAESKPQSSPSMTLAYFYRGFIFGTKLGKVEDAVASFQQAIELELKFVQAHYNLGDALFYLERFDDAINAHSKVLSLAPDHLYALVERGDAYLRSGQYSAAIDDYTKAINIHQWTRLYISRGQAYEISGQANLAIGDYLEALDLDPFCDVAGLRLATFRGRGYGKSIYGDYQKAPGPYIPYVKKYYETALRILGRSNPSPSIKTDANEDDEALSLAEYLRSFRHLTEEYTFYGEQPGFISEISQICRAGVDLIQLLMEENPSDDQLVKSVETLLFEGSNILTGRLSYQNVHCTLKSLLSYSSIRNKLGQRIISILEIIGSQQSSYIQALKLLNRRLHSVNSITEIQLDPEAQQLSKLIDRFCAIGEQNVRLSGEEQQVQWRRREAINSFLHKLEDLLSSLCKDYQISNYFPFSDLLDFQKILIVLRDEGQSVLSVLNPVVNFLISHNKRGYQLFSAIEFLESQDPSYKQALDSLGLPLIPVSPDDEIRPNADVQRLAGLITEFQHTVKSSIHAQDKDNWQVPFVAEHWLQELDWINRGSSCSPRRLLKFLTALSSAGEHIKDALQAVTDCLIAHNKLDSNLIVIAEFLKNQDSLYLEDQGSFCGDQSSSYLDAVEIINLPLVSLVSNGEVRTNPDVIQLVELLTDFGYAVKNSGNIHSTDNNAKQMAVKNVIFFFRSVNSDPKSSGYSFSNFQRNLEFLYSLGQDICDKLQPLIDFIVANTNYGSYLIAARDFLKQQDPSYLQAIEILDLSLFPLTLGRELEQDPVAVQLAELITNVQHAADSLENSEWQAKHAVADFLSRIKYLLRKGEPDGWESERNISALHNVGGSLWHSVQSLMDFIAAHAKLQTDPETVSRYSINLDF
ncbi:MAG: tetratricopeptide repeat protein [Stenomitos rutilans HA7619-LM2]|jgi:tetratricopeptide (TPR) repeat protein|nr:tetratricopeptide repeat protein [Stenomitos rutilans HA7619-LM2]